MKILFNCRKRNERLEEPLFAQGHEVVYNLWDIGKIKAAGVDAVLFEFKQIVKEEFRFLKLSLALKKSGIPRATWCLDLPNIGASTWKVPAVLRLGLVDVFATHSLQGLTGGRAKVLYLPNAAWTGRYNLRGRRIEDFKDSSMYRVDVSFIGNIDSQRYKEHTERVLFLGTLEGRLQRGGISYSFVDSKNMSFDEQVELIQRSRINLNYGCGADRKGERSWGLPERCYGIPACGGFLLSEERRHGRDDFIEGDEIVMFRDLDDCMEKIRHYLNNDVERRTIAENAYKKVISSHTYANRAQTLVESIRGVKT